MAVTERLWQENEACRARDASSSHLNELARWLGTRLSLTWIGMLTIDARNKGTIIQQPHERSRTGG